MGEHPFDSAPVGLYGVVLLMAAIAYYILQRTIIASQGTSSILARAVGNDLKGKLSPLLYAAAILASFVELRISHLLYVLVAVIWLVPDRRIEHAIRGERTTG
jgi:uncharacterized membrane protein